MRQPRKPITKTVSVLLSLIMIMGVLSVIPPSLFAAGGVNYIFRSWDGERVVEEVRTCTQYNSISKMTTNDLTEGWHVVDKSRTFSDSLYVRYGTVNLILCDDTTLTDNIGISVAPEATLNIYGQGKGTGKLYIHATYDEQENVGNDAALIGGSSDAGNINIHGGGKNGNGGEIEIASANVITSSTGGGAGIGGGIGGSSSDVYIHSDTVVCSISTTTKSHQAFADLLNMCVGDAKMKPDDTTYSQASVCALSLLIDWFDPEFSGCAIGGGNEGSGGAEHIIIADGQELTDGTTLYSGSYDSSQHNLFKEKTLTPNGLLHVDSSEPYIEDTGAYIPGEIEHYEQGGNYFAVNEDGTVGAKLDSVEILYFDFALLSDDTYQIKKYTGPMDDLTRLEIPKTFKGKEITVLGDEESFMNGTGTPCQSTLVLNENIAVIKGSAFAESMLTAVEGDTSGLRQIKDSAFSRANSSDGCAIALNLDYPGVITVDNNAFAYDNITARVTHATTLSSEGRASGIRYIITDDAHTYGDPVWMWENDHSGAAAKITCTDSRCLHEETVKATVTAQ